MGNVLLTLRDLEVAFAINKKQHTALKKVSFQINRKERVGIVGESGCGKSLTSLSVMGLLPESASLTAGAIVLEGRSLASATEKSWKSVRGKEISMIFQDPMTALNPLMPVGKQIAEMALAHLTTSKQEAKRPCH